MSRFIYFLVTVLVVASLVVLAGWEPSVHAWVVHISGTDNVSGPEYGWWSGFGSVFPWEVGFFAAIWTHLYQNTVKINCHVHRCLRIGSYPAGQYTVCKRHAREIVGEPTVQHIKLHHLLHSRARQTQAGFPPKDQ